MRRRRTAARRDGVNTDPEVPPLPPRIRSGRGPVRGTVGEGEAVSGEIVTDVNTRKVAEVVN